MPPRLVMVLLLTAGGLCFVLGVVLMGVAVVTHQGAWAQFALATAGLVLIAVGMDLRRPRGRR